MLAAVFPMPQHSSVPTSNPDISDPSDPQMAGIYTYTYIYTYMRRTVVRRVLEDVKENGVGVHVDKPRPRELSIQVIDLGGELLVEEHGHLVSRLRAFLMYASIQPSQRRDAPDRRRTRHPDLPCAESIQSLLPEEKRR